VHLLVLFTGIYLSLSVFPWKLSVCRLPTAKCSRMCYKLHEFLGNPSIMKATLLREQSTFSTLSRLSFEIFSFNFVSHNTNAFATHDASTVAVDKKKTTLLEEESIFSFVSRLPLEGSSWHLIWLNINEIATHDASTVAVDQKENHFTWRRKYLFVCISPSFGGIFLTLNMA
jgi:hypothetical protein